VHKTAIKNQNLTNLLFASERTGKQSGLSQRYQAKRITPSHSEFAGMLVNASMVSTSPLLVKSNHIKPSQTILTEQTIQSQSIVPPNQGKETVPVDPSVQKNTHKKPLLNSKILGTVENPIATDGSIKPSRIDSALQENKYVDLKSSVHYVKKSGHVSTENSKTAKTSTEPTVITQKPAQNPKQIFHQPRSSAVLPRIIDPNQKISATKSEITPLPQGTTYTEQIAAKGMRHDVNDSILSLPEKLTQQIVPSETSSGHISEFAQKNTPAGTTIPQQGEKKPHFYYITEQKSNVQSLKPSISYSNAPSETREANSEEPASMSVRSQLKNSVAASVKHHINSNIPKAHFQNNNYNSWDETKPVQQLEYQAHRTATSSPPTVNEYSVPPLHQNLKNYDTPWIHPNVKTNEPVHRSSGKIDHSIVHAIKTLQVHHQAAEIKYPIPLLEDVGLVKQYLTNKNANWDFIRPLAVPFVMSPIGEITEPVNETGRIILQSQYLPEISKEIRSEKPGIKQAESNTTRGRSESSSAGSSSNNAPKSSINGFSHFFGIRKFSMRDKPEIFGAHQAETHQIEANPEKDDQNQKTQKIKQQISDEPGKSSVGQIHIDHEVKSNSSGEKVQKSTIENFVRQIKTPVETASVKTQISDIEKIQNLTKLADQIRAKAKLLNPKGGTVIDAKLSPAKLGTVRIQIEVSHDQMRLHFSAERPEASIALQQAQSELGAILSDYGYKMTQCDVQDQPSQHRLTDMATNSNSQQRQQHQRSAGNRSYNHQSGDDTIYKTIKDFGYNTMELVA